MTRRSNRAFSLLELATTVTIMSALAAVSIVGLNAVTDRQEAARVLAEMQAVADVQMRYALLADGFAATGAQLGNLPDDMVVTSGPVATPGVISMAVGSQGTLALAAVTSDGRCQALRVPTLFGGAGAGARTEIAVAPDATCEARTALLPGEWQLPGGAPTDAVVMFAAADQRPSQAVVNTGSLREIGDGYLGSTPQDDANDPIFLDNNGDTYVYLPSTAGNYLSADVPVSLATGFDIEAHVALDDWDVQRDHVVVSRWDLPTASRSFRAGVTSVAGSPRLFVDLSLDGTTTSRVVSDASLEVPDGDSQLWVRYQWSSTAATVSFSTSADGVVYDQLGSPRPGLPLSLFGGSSALTVGSSSPSDEGLAGKVYAVRVRDASRTDVALLDTSSCGQAACESLTSETWSVERSGSGVRAVVVDRPLFAIGAERFVTIPDGNGLDLDGDATVVLALRAHGGLSAGPGQIVSKRDSVNTSGACGQGWSITLSDPATLAATVSLAAAGSCLTGVSSVGLQNGAVTLVGFTRSVSDQNAETFNGVALSGLQERYDTSSVAGSAQLANDLPVRIGLAASSADGPASFELFGFAVFPRELSSAELAAVMDSLSGRATGS